MNCETILSRQMISRGLLKRYCPAYSRCKSFLPLNEDVPQDIIEREKDIYKAQVANKPPQIVEKIVEGKLDKFFGDMCLLEQAFVKDPEQKLR